MFFLAAAIPTILGTIAITVATTATATVVARATSDVYDKLTEKEDDEDWAITWATNADTFIGFSVKAVVLNQSLVAQAHFNATQITERDAMSIFNFFGSRPKNLLAGAIDYGGSKKNGSHDHRYNKGKDRTPAQKTGDKKLGGTKVGKAWSFIADGQFVEQVVAM